MITIFSILCQRCGLSRQEAATFLKVRNDTVYSWSTGRNKAPQGAIDELRELYTRIESAADASLEEIKAMVNKRGNPGVIELGIAVDDHDAKLLGWPCVGAHGAVLGLVAARIDLPITIVPRGATVATAAAADANTP